MQSYITTGQRDNYITESSLNYEYAQNSFQTNK